MKEIRLTKGQVAIVDDEDYERLCGYKWYAQFSDHTRSYYAARRLPWDADGHRSVLYMHREVIRAAAGTRVDHINHDTLDQRKSNLRVCTIGQNGSNRKLQTNNSSGYKGVDWRKADRKWRAQIQVHGKSIHIGYYDSPVDAARAYDESAAVYHGKFALTNKALGLLPDDVAPDMITRERP